MQVLADDQPKACLSRRTRGRHRSPPPPPRPKHEAQAPSLGWRSAKPRLQLADPPQELPPSGTASLCSRRSLPPFHLAPTATPRPFLAGSTAQLGSLLSGPGRAGPVRGGLTPNTALSRPEHQLCLGGHELLPGPREESRPWVTGSGWLTRGAALVRSVPTSSRLRAWTTLWTLPVTPIHSEMPGRWVLPRACPACAHGSPPGHAPQPPASGLLTVVPLRCLLASVKLTLAETHSLRPRPREAGGTSAFSSWCPDCRPTAGNQQVHRWVEGPAGREAMSKESSPGKGLPGLP